MSDMNERIGSWRATLTAREGITASAVDELEDHLRTSLENLAGTGLTDEEVFHLAARRIGHVPAVEEAFYKANPAAVWGRRLRWMVLGYLVCALASIDITAINAAVGFLLIKQGLGVGAVIALRCLTHFLLITLIVALVFAMANGRLESLLPLRRADGLWLINGWVLAICIAVTPWLVAGAHMLINVLVTRNVSAEQVGTWATSGAATRVVLPSAIPLILFILAIGLGKRASST